MEQEHVTEAIAVIGMAGRFPGARNLTEFWQNLRDGVESLQCFSDEELTHAGVPADIRRRPNFVPVAGIVPDADLFDAAYFGYTPQEAAILDPQQRVFLETCATALEDAGYAPESYSGSIGVYAGCAYPTYLLHNLWGHRDIRDAMNGYQAMLLNDKDYLATRVSFKLNLRGPAATIQTACSTSLVAVHHACTALLGYQCDIALAGGAVIHAPRARGYLYEEGMIFSADGHCRPFDAKAGGTVGGEGVGVVVLKRLSEALADGDPIDAVILGTAINNDGAQKAGYTAPSVEGQAEAITAAQSFAGISPDTISYIEAHGTGTALGDPIEIAALTQAFRMGTDKTQFCTIGSLKSNVGHPEAAAGIAGLIKLVLMLKAGQIPPTLHFQTPNPNIDFARSPFRVADKLQKWETDGVPRRAGVSSMGIGGTNAHAVLEQAPQPALKTNDAVPATLFTLSAKTENALNELTANFANWLQTSPDGTNRRDVAFTLQTGRTSHAHRRFIVVREGENAAEICAKLPAKQSGAGKSNRPPRIAFVFPGQGAQYVGMGKQLYAHSPIFRDHVDRCSAFLEPLLGLDLRDIMFAEAGEEASAALKQTRLAQPALFVVSSGVAKVWKAWGVTPDIMLGHSVGEYTAAYLSGVLQLEDALTLIAARGRMMQSVEPGGMLAVRLPADTVRARLPQGLELAADNAPELCVVAGKTDTLDAFAQTLENESVGIQALHTSHAFHSAMMEPILTDFIAEASKIAIGIPSIPYLSNVTGQQITPDDLADPAYWAKHLRGTVRFREGMNALLSDPNTLILEVGSGQTLAQLAKMQGTEEEKKQNPVPCISSAAHARQPEEDVFALHFALGSLWAAGVTIDWQAVYSGETRRRVHLPTYPFQRKRFWIDPPSTISPSVPKMEPLCAEWEPESMNSMAFSSNDISSSQAVSPRRERLLSELTQITCDTAGLDAAEITPDLEFLEMGFDSLLLVQLSQAFRRKYDIRIAINDLMELYATLNAVAAYLDSVLPADADPETVPPASPAPPLTLVSNGVAPAPVALPAPIAPVLSANAPAVPVPPAVQPASMPLVTSGSALEQMIAQQLQIMQAQIALLSQTPLTPTLSPASAQARGEREASRIVTSPSQNNGLPSPQRGTSDPGRKAGDDGQSPTSADILGPYRPMKREAAGGLTAQQAKYLEEFSARYLAKTAGSKRQTAEDRPFLADPRVVVGFRQALKELVYPIVATRSAGSKIWDVDGNEYIDLVMGFGTNLLGHSPAFITEALRKQLDNGVEVGPQSLTAGKVTRLFAKMVDMERVALLNTGSEAVMTAMRIARAITGKNKIAVFAGGYHGNFDAVLMRPKATNGKRTPFPIASGVMPGTLEDNILLDYGAPEALDVIRAHADELAAVLVEPIQSRDLKLQPREFVQEIRRITAQCGAAMIMDDVVMGFRLHQAGSQAFYDVKADMATFGKIVGGGLPIGAIAGSPKWLDAVDGGVWNYGDDSFPQSEMTFYAGTFAKHPLTMAAAWETLQHLKIQGNQLQENLNRRTYELAATLNDIFRRHRVPMYVECAASLFKFRYGAEVPFPSLFLYHLNYKGIHLWEGRNAFLSTAHTDADLAAIARIVEETVLEMRAGGFMPEGDSRAPTGDPNVPFALGDRQLPLEPSVACPCASSSDVCNRSENSCALSEAQQDIFFAAKMDANAATSYNESFVVSLRGRLDVDCLCDALQVVVDRHEALRATFNATGETQAFHAQCRVELPLIDLTAFSESERAAELERLTQEEAEQTFDLSVLPLFRGRLVRIAPDEHRLFITFHHLILDGWSSGIVFEEWSEAYTALVNGTPLLMDQPASFRHYVQAQATPEYQSKIVDAEAYWREQFATPASYIELPADRSRPAVKTYASAQINWQCDAELFAKLKQASSRLRSTPFHFILASFNVFVARMTGQTDLTLGIVAAGQAEEEWNGLVGHCANLLPLRTQIDLAQPFTAYLAMVRQSVGQAFAHQQCRFGQIVRSLALPPDASRLPLLGIVFNLDRSGGMGTWSNLDAEYLGSPRTFLRYDIQFNFTQTDSELTLDCDFNTDLYDEATVTRWLGHFAQVLANAVAAPDSLAADLPLLTDAERHTLLHAWNPPQTNYPRQSTVPALFAAQVQATPNAIALRSDTETVTYAELNARANQLAHWLQSQSIGAGSCVALSLPRSTELIVATLAILKTGAAYVPLESSHPASRLAFILRDTQAALVLTNEALAAKLPPQSPPIALWETLVPELTALSTDDLTECTDAESLAYVMYTSGSTGTPKGVCVPHRAIVRLVRNTNYIDIQPSDVFLQFAPFGFDASTFEVWGALLNGASVAIFPLVTPSLHELATFMEAQGVTTTFLTTALFHQLADSPSCAKLRGLRFLLAGGEVTSLVHFRKAQAVLPNTTFVHCYGPTENTTFSTFYPYPKAGIADAVLPLGKSIAHSSAHVLDEWGHPAPIGVAGELCVGGDGLALRYLNQPVLTAEKFIHSPMVGQRLYRTGDLAKWLPDGNLLFLGRTDDQIKLRGFRIELGEIETALRRHPNVNDAAVILQEIAPQDKRLLAFVVPSAEISANELRGFLTEHLPDHAIPAAFVMRDALPLTANGKRDRRALLTHASQTGLVMEAQADNAPADDELTVRLLELWRSVLNVPTATLDDDFFELGGHSLLAVRLFVDIEKEWGVNLPLSVLFHTATVRTLAERINNHNQHNGHNEKQNESTENTADTATIQNSDAGSDLSPVPCPLSPSWDCLVPIRTEGTRTPFFAVHAIGANVLNYRLLSQYLGDDQPFYGFQAIGLDGKTAPLETVEEMAAAYLSVLRSVQPHGPYFLGGGSSGGVIAFEMARQLQNAGETVGMVALLDTYYLFEGAKGHRHYASRRGLLDEHLGQMLELSMSQQVRYLARNAFNKVRVKLGKMRPKPSDDLPTTLLRLRKAILQAVARYEPQPFNGHVTMFVATQAQHRTLYDPRLQWGDVVKGRFEVHLLDSDHDSMMEEPAVQELAAKLRQTIDRVIPHTDAADA